MAEPAPLCHVAVIFDLDGTLIDSAPDIHATANRVFGAMGHAAFAPATVQGHVGRGLAHLVASLLAEVGEDPQGPALAPTIARFETEYLTAHSLTTAYPGVTAVLATLAASGAALGLCTNKPVGPARAIMDHLGLTGHFRAILGGDSLPVRKPDPEHLHATARALGRPRVIFVGDSEVDAETAAAARLPFLLFTEGYAKSPASQIAHDGQFSDFSALPGLIAGLA